MKLIVASSLLKPEYKIRENSEDNVVILKLNTASGQWIIAYGPYTSKKEAEDRLAVIKKGGPTGHEWAKLSTKYGSKK